MFNDTDDGQTQYCPMCLEWAEKYEKLKAENEGLKIKHQRYRECSIQFNQQLKQALEEIEKIACMWQQCEGGYCHEMYAISKICNEVLKYE